jgi:hypothetical protein
MHVIELMLLLAGDGKDGNVLWARIKEEDMRVVRMRDAIPSREKLL